MSLSSGVIQWCSRNLAFSQNLPSSTWVGALAPAEELKDMLSPSLKEESGPGFIAAILLLGCSSFISVLPPFPNQ